MSAQYLVTGFEAFGGESINPTEILLRKISENPQQFSNFKVQLLPVDYDKAAKIVLSRPDLNTFRGIICLGLAGGRAKISLERVALNWVESREPDNSGKIPDRNFIDSQEEKAKFTNFPLENLKNSLESAGLPVEISLNAGGYVCNYTYFQLLKSRTPPWVIFIHVPFLQVQVLGKKENTPFLTESQFQIFLDVLVQSFRADEIEFRNF